MKFTMHFLMVIVGGLIGLIIEFLAGLIGLIAEFLSDLWFFPMTTYTIAKYCATNNKYFWDLTDEDNDNMEKAVDEEG